MDFLQLLRYLLTGYRERTPKGEPLSYGELGRLYGPGGSTVFTERMVGVQDPRLYGGRQTNIPLLVKGQVDVPNILRNMNPTWQQFEMAIRRAAERIKQGQSFPNFATIEESNADAKRRHRIIDTIESSRPESGLREH